MNRVMSFLRKMPAASPAEKAAPVPTVGIRKGRRKSFRAKPARSQDFEKRKKKARKTEKRSRRINRRKK